MTKEKNRELLKRIDKGIKRGVTRALEEHKRAGQSIVIWQDGKIVKVPAVKICTGGKSKARHTK